MSIELPCESINPLTSTARILIAALCSMSRPIEDEENEGYLDGTSEIYEVDDEDDEDISAHIDDDRDEDPDEEEDL